MSLKKKLLLMVSVSALLVLLISAGSLSYFSDSDEVTNVFKVGEMDTTLTEPKWPGGDVPYYPGASYNKNPTVTATEGNMYFRLKVELLDGNGSLITDATALNQIWNCIYYDSSDGGSTGGASDTDEGWIKKGVKYTSDELSTFVSSNGVKRCYNDSLFTVADGSAIGSNTVFFNYVGTTDSKYILQEGNKATLFTDVAIPYDIMTEDYEALAGLAGSTFQIKISVQAVQAEIIDAEGGGGTDAKAQEAYNLMDEMWESGNTSTASVTEDNSSSTVSRIKRKALSIIDSDATEAESTASDSSAGGGSTADTKTVSSSDTADSSTDLDNKSTADNSSSNTGSGGGGSSSQTSEETTAAEAEAVSEQTSADEAVTETAAEQAAEEVTEAATETAAEETTEQPAEATVVEEPTEETAEEPSEVSVEEPTGETAEQTVEETADDSFDLGEAIVDAVEEIIESE